MNDIRKTGPKDVFGNLLVVIGLYVSVISFGTLSFALINFYFPDVLQYEYGRYARNSLRWPLAVLIIVFPLYVWLTSYLQKELERHPEKKDLRTRKWLLHFTLFATAIVIVIDLVTLVFRFLNGDLTIRFVLKVLAVLAIAIVVFTYYLWNIKKDIPATKHKTMKWFVRGVVVFAALITVSGFFVAGSPFAERTKRFDERRTQDLQTVQYEIVNYWQIKEKLPQELSELRDDIRGFTAPRDPETSKEYGYKVLAERQFELCATFKTSSVVDLYRAGKSISAPRTAYPAYDENWFHDAGETCFTRTIDPDRFPPFIPPPKR